MLFRRARGVEGVGERVERAPIDATTDVSPPAPILTDTPAFHHLDSDTLTP